MSAATAVVPPSHAEAHEPPEARGRARDEVDLLVSRDDGHWVDRFRSLPDLLRPGDLLVVNSSATLPASLPARVGDSEFRFNLSTWYGRDVWLGEARWSFDRPGPVPLLEGETFDLAGERAVYLAPYPGLPRLGFVRVAGDLWVAMQHRGQPIHYAYVPASYPLETYQTVFATVPGSAEMPSAGRPFSPAILSRLSAQGVRIAPVVLHTGVSSLESEPDGEHLPLTPEPFEVPASTVAEIERARAHGHRVVAVGTTVVRALESARRDGRLGPARGFTSAYLDGRRPVESVDGLLTGLHEPRTTHRALLTGFLGRAELESAYRLADARGLLWHEFGDSHLILRS